MRLPPSFTTVTPLSKYLAMALLIALPFAGFYLGRQYQQQRSEQLSSRASDVYRSQSECEQATGKVCLLMMCDYVPPGKSFREVCGNVGKGWVPTKSVLPSPWKTYENKSLGFSFQYPSPWTITTDNYDSSPCTAYSCDSSMGFDGVFLKSSTTENFRNAQMSIRRVRNNGKTIREYFNEKDNSCCGDDVEPTYLGDRIMSAPILSYDGGPARVLDDPPGHSPISYITKIRWIVFEKDNRIYLIEMVTDTEFHPALFQEYADRILSTFRFLDEKNSPQ